MFFSENNTIHTTVFDYKVHSLTWLLSGKIFIYLHDLQNILISRREADCKFTKSSIFFLFSICWTLYRSTDGKASTCNAGDLGSIPGLGRFPGEGNGNPLQDSCLENSMDRGAWWATVHGVAKSWTWLSD